MIIQGNKITAEDGKVLKRTFDNYVAGKSVTLGYTWYNYEFVNGKQQLKKLENKFLELPEHYIEIDAPVVDPEVVVVVPKIISKLQATMALLSMDKLDDVEAAVEASERAVQIMYRDATIFEYDNQMLTGMCLALGIAKDDFFILAKTL